jgi:HlyD family secretion protein
LQAAREALATARETLGRHAEVKAARSDLAAAQADAAQKHWSVERKQVNVPANGEIADTYFRPGEWVPMGAPVASLLPDGQRRIRFFIPQADVARLPVGTRVLAHCDGCPRAIQGMIDYIAPQAEYTPPVIYSRDTRARLVFRVEAAPDPRRCHTPAPRRSHSTSASRPDGRHPGDRRLAGSASISPARPPWMRLI